MIEAAVANEIETPVSVNTIDTGVKDRSGSLAKYMVSGLAVAAIIVYRLVNMELRWTEIVLLAIAVVPWLSSFTESFKLGKDGFDLVFKKLEEAKKEIKAEVKTETDKITTETNEKLNEVAEITSVTQSLAIFGAGGKKDKRIKRTRLAKRTAEEEPDEAIEISDDPQKGKWGGNRVDKERHRKISVRVETLPNNNYFRRLHLRVESTDPKNFPLTDVVTFYLHPTFANSVIDVKPTDGIAEVSLVAYGAFTVGAKTDGGATRLEYDISEDGKDNDDPFYDR